MKNNHIAPIVFRHEPVIERLIASRHQELIEQAKKNGQHFALKNLPAPDETNIEPYINDLKNGYFHLAAQVSKHLQTGSHGPEARMEIVHLQDKDKQLAEEIKNREHQNHMAMYELGNFNPTALNDRFRIASLVSLIITIGEILYNTKAFQIIGENMLFAFIISVSITVAVLAFSNLVPFVLKAVKKKLHRWLVIFASFALIMGLFISLAIFRTQYLAAHGQKVSPVNFVIINIFFFIVATLLSYFVLPTWKEIRDHAHKNKKYKEKERRVVEIKNLYAEKEAIKENLLERNKVRIQLANYDLYLINEVKSMFRESLGAFQSSNLINRSDKCVPKGFSDQANDIEIEQLNDSITNLNRLAS